MAVLPARVLFGAAYYHEYRPTHGREYRPGEQLKADLDLMADARFTVIRVGESVWSTWEPDERPLRPRLAGSRCSTAPTNAVSPWSSAHRRTPCRRGWPGQYPEIAGERATGQRIGWGARQEVDFTHPAFRFHAERVIRKIVAAVRRPPGGHRLPGRQRAGHRTPAQPRRLPAVRRPPARAGTATSRRSTGSGGWSTGRTGCRPGPTCGRRTATPSRSTTSPGGSSRPRQVTEFIGWQADIVREYAQPRPVRHHLHLLHPPGDRRRRADRRAWTSPRATRTTHAGRSRAPRPARRTAAAELEDHRRLGAVPDRRPDVLLRARRRSWSPRPTRSSIGMPWDNRPAYDGQWRQAAWALVARGARMIEYWHWHTLHFGAETYWGGVLPHSGRARPDLRASWRGWVPSSRRRARSSPGWNRTRTSRWSTRRRASG